VALAEDLQAALKHGGLELYYQPQVALSDGRVVGVEALIRWHHPGRGLLLPGEFIPIAERRGLMPALGRWVISAACEQLAAWRKAEFAVPAMAINLSPAQFKATGILENDLRDALAEWQIPPGTVELEIPEAALTEVATEGGLEIERVRLLGVRFVVDDFGTGYSSLDKLVAYKIARLKIAPGFVGGANVNARDAAIVRAAVGLARELGIGVIAEGIETKDQAAFLLEAGCTCGQGFYFSRPVPAAVIAESLRRGRLAPGAPSTPAEGHTSDGDSPKLAGFM
jgi:EAL domain-containing protein (putative c-di-GMP-specific phosphodiesterase class I)